MYSVKEYKYTFIAEHAKTYIQYNIDKSNRVRFKLPIVLCLKKDYVT